MCLALPCLAVYCSDAGHISAARVVCHTSRSVAVVSPSSIVSPMDLRSLPTVSLHRCLCPPGLLFPPTFSGFQSYRRFGYLSFPILRVWPNHLSLFFLMSVDTCGCFVCSLMSLLQLCCHHLTFRIILRHLVSNPSSLSSCALVVAHVSDAYISVGMTTAR